MSIEERKQKIHELGSSEALGNIAIHCGDKLEILQVYIEVNVESNQSDSIFVLKPHWMLAAARKVGQRREHLPKAGRSTKGRHTAALSGSPGNFSCHEPRAVRSHLCPDRRKKLSPTAIQDVDP